MRTRCRLGVVLHREDRAILDCEALDRAVVQIDRGHPAGRRQALGVEREAVVLAGDRDSASEIVTHRLVPAMMAELELEGPAAESEPEQLMAEADPEQRHRLLDQLRPPRQ